MLVFVGDAVDIDVVDYFAVVVVVIVVAVYVVDDVYISLTIVYYLGFSWRIKEGIDNTHRVRRPAWSAGPESQSPSQNLQNHESRIRITNH